MDLDRFKLILAGLIESGVSLKEARHTIEVAAMEYAHSRAVEAIHATSQMAADRVANLDKDN